MNTMLFGKNGKKLRLLVTIASFGEKNLSYLSRIIRRYRAMDLDVEIVVFSEAPKDVDGADRVVVGLPSKNPWSLPFAHKALLAENLDRFDLFAYSEDDIEVTQENIEAFLRVSSELREDEIAGFLRYEVSEAGEIFLPDCHAHFHWKPDSVRQRGDFTIAEFTNEHAAFYLLTQDQLRGAIASGGFLRDPCEGEYDMLCTAATDPYTNCGFRKIVCVRPLEDFLIHHMSNRYVGQLGVSMAAFQEQIQTLVQIGEGAHPATVLCTSESKALHREWSKSYYEQPFDELLEMIPSDFRTVLSIGCGSGATEDQLRKRGALVTALPLDSVIGAQAARRGLEVIYGSTDECLWRLNGREFDCVLTTDLLHLQPDPRGFLEQFSRFVRPGGALVIAGPNFDFASTFIKRVLQKSNCEGLSDFAISGIRTIGPHELLSHIRDIGFNTSSLRWYDRVKKPDLPRPILKWFPSAASKRWIAQARRFS